ncbi:MAG: hypothetical protein COA80_08960 [Leeuwenhoekiella sp.]|nr:MAG: hypothetical protein COA80_08960 [Leeuwenhoekiella sp.]
MDFLIYILKSTAVLSLFYLIYLALLKNETFFDTNRKFLIGGILISFILPLMEFTRTVYRELPVFDFPLTEAEVAVAEIPQNSFEFGIWEVALSFYFLGVVVMTFLFLRKLCGLLRFFKSQNYAVQDGFRVIQADGLEAPFSFFKYIVVDQHQYTAQDFEMILEHEQTHARQYHSLDTLFMQLMLIINWFNPLAWFYRSAVIQNLEYLADATTAGKLSNRKNYQLALVKVAVPGKVPALTHSFYQSFIKKRIVMLNKQSSSKTNQLKMAVILPVLAVFIWGFNFKEEVHYVDSNTSGLGEQPEVEVAVKASTVEKESEATDENLKATTQSSNEDEQTRATHPQAGTVQTSFKRVITNTFTKSDLDALAKELESDYQVILSFSKLDYNDAGQLVGIKISLKDKSSGNQSSSSYSGSTPLNDIVIYRSEDGTFGVVSGRNSMVQAQSMTEAEYAAFKERTEARVAETKARVTERREELEMRKAEMEAEVELRKAEIEAEMELRKAELEARRELREREMEAKRAEMEELKVMGYGRSGSATHNSRFKTPDSSNLRPKEILLYGAPKDGFSIRTYGTGENSDEQPLFIKDGKEISHEELKMIDPEDIESLSVLKDASATALYKEKGKNGVILITTKSKKN